MGRGVGTGLTLLHLMVNLAISTRVVPGMPALNHRLPGFCVHALEQDFSHLISPLAVRCYATEVTPITLRRSENAHACHGR